MKQSLRLYGIGLTAGLLAPVSLTFLNPSPAIAEICTQQTSNDSLTIEIRNATNSPITVQWINTACQEASNSDPIEPGRAFQGTTYPGNAFRIRNAQTGELLQEVVATESDYTFTIGLIEDSDPGAAFLATLNQVREGRNLPPLEYDHTLNLSCQWLAALMGQYDVMDHDAVVVGGSSYQGMRDLGDRLTHFGWQGGGSAEALAGGYFARIETAGSTWVLDWSSSNTHYRPFLSLDNQVFTHVGFGYAPSATKPNEYYACAIFGNPGGDP